MGYSCPVCGDPQADDIHLANHLAFTAIARGGDHETWLDEHVTEWGGMGEAELADAVTDHAEETEYPQVFEDTTGEQEHRHRGTDLPPGTEQLTPDGSLDAEAEAILAEAREMTRKRRERRRDDTDDRESDEATADESE
ncbi:MAG: DUF5810 domain-containing protein [Halovenus sp.]